MSVNVQRAMERIKRLELSIAGPILCVYGSLRHVHATFEVPPAGSLWSYLASAPTCTFVLVQRETHIGKSTLLLQLVANLSAAGLPCLLASGEESRDQVALRARRLGILGDRVAFASGRELGPLLSAARAERPFLLAVDSIQSLRDSAGGQVPGGPAQVRGCTDALVGLAKTEGIAVLLAGHVTKDGDVAGPRTLEHAVDVVLTFDGEPRSGLRMLSGGKNRFGAEGEVAWFEMGATGWGATGCTRSTPGPCSAPARESPDRPPPSHA
jgi:predicted ATP-dependent serine protease